MCLLQSNINVDKHLSFCGIRDKQYLVLQNLTRFICTNFDVTRKCKLTNEFRKKIILIIIITSNLSNQFQTIESQMKRTQTKIKK